jgi:hypothetical protein
LLQDKPIAVEPALRKLRGFLEQIDENPNVDLDGPIKRLRQVRTTQLGCGVVCVVCAAGVQ